MWIRGILHLGAFALCAALAFAGAFAFFKTDELARAKARLSLYRSTVEAELERFAHLAFILAQDPFVMEVALGGAQDPLDARLASFARAANVDAIYFMDRRGQTLSASNAGTPRSFVGQNYGFRPYFQTALSGQSAEFYGIGATTGIPGYFFAEPVRLRGRVAGVIAIKVDLSDLQDSWQEAGERVILANADGVVLLASRGAWRYRALRPLSAEKRAEIAAAKQFAGQPLDPLDWAEGRRNSATLSGERFLYTRTRDLPNGWTLLYFASDNVVRIRALLSTTLLALLAVAGFVGVQIQRANRIGAALRRSEHEEAQLRGANMRLAVEIEERRNAEARLRKTQAELERAGRLAALGQLAASVTHELGQPIAAMRNHIAASEMQHGASALSQRMGELTNRMEGITRQLKFFSRKGRDNMEPLDLRDAMQAALGLMEADFATHGVNVQITQPDAPLTLHANRLRIEQVMTNLLRNALHAMAEQEAPCIHVSLGQDARGLWFEVADNGEGLGDMTLEDLREPFSTTRESGLGMGLGLTISTGIVEDHGGQMRAQNRAGGGAVFRAIFPNAPTREGTP